MNHPTQLGKYTLLGVLGEGAMGVVYRGMDPVIQRQVAIKTIHKHLMSEGDADTQSGSQTAARFRNEARAAGRLQHPGIVAIYEFGEEAQTTYIAMEYVEGLTLAKHMGRYAAAGLTVPVREVHLVMAQLLSALEHAHQQGVWHRDIKPANLIVTTNGRLKIADFGVARLEDSSLTQAASMIGTPSHMAPEQFMGEPPDRRLDIYAAGVVLYQLLTNRLPFTGSPTTLMFNVINSPALPPSSVEGSVSPSYFDAIVARAMAKSAAHRYQTAEEFATALALYAPTAIGASATPPTPGFAAADNDTTVAWVNDNDTAAPLSALALNLPTPPPEQGTITGFDAALLKSMESTLTRQLGPVARLLVRRAATAALDEDDLRQRLAGHLGSEEERAVFLANARKSAPVEGMPSQADTRTIPLGAMPAVASFEAYPDTVETVLATQISQATRGATSITPADDLNAAYLEQARECVARRVGPIAKIMVRKAASQSTGRALFIDALCAQCEDMDDRDQLARELRAL